MISSTPSRLLKAIICNNALSPPGPGGGPFAPVDIAPPPPDAPIPAEAASRLLLDLDSLSPRSTPLTPVKLDQDGNAEEVEEEDDAEGGGIGREDVKWLSYSGESVGETRAK